MESPKPPVKESLESTQYLQLEELNDALERALVLQTQQNYMDLKKKFIELSQQSQHAQTELQTLLNERGQHVELLYQMGEALKAENQQLREQQQELKATCGRSHEKIEIQGRRAEKGIQRSNRTPHREHCKELLSEIRRIQVSTDEEVQSLKAELREERQRRIELETVAQKNRVNLEVSRKIAVSKQNELLAVR
ncbi:hypothetical protein OSTOST_19437, partial [Ostertagia ostertagi]